MAGGALTRGAVEFGRSSSLSAGNGCAFEMLQRKHRQQEQERQEQENQVCACASVTAVGAPCPCAASATAAVRFCVLGTGPLQALASVRT